MQDARKRRILAELGVELYVPREHGATAPVPASASPATPTLASLPPEEAFPGCGLADGLEWEPLRATVAACTRCPLHAGRTQTVFGVGRRDARWMIIGEAPGAEEDRRGEPFVGRAGQLLDSMMRALGPGREQV
jgi:DNA polymerase